MFFLTRPDTQAVHLLADLLETIEVTADELLDQKLAGQDLAAIRAMSDVEVETQLTKLRNFVGRIRELELGIVAKLGQARDKARAVSRSDWRLRPIMMLFTSGTQGFADYLDAEDSPAQREFNGANQTFPFLRSRGLVSPQTISYDGSVELIVTDSFRLLGAMPLRDLRERCEATLNALDAHYDLYVLEDDAAEEAAVLGAPIQGERETAVAVAIEPAAAFAPEHATMLEAEKAPISVVTAEPSPPEQATVASQVEAPKETPSETEIAAAQMASEAGLKGLTERLADLQADIPEAQPTSAPIKAA